MTLFPTKSSATFSECGRYRYTLWRAWDDGRPVIAWLMLNPSTADADQDDPTIRRCQSFARAWGAGGIVVVNLFALRSTEPSALLSDPNPVAPACDPGANDAAILEATRGRRIVAAWGVHGVIGGRADAVLRLLNGRWIDCLGMTKDGHPRHPLYVAGKTAPISYAWIGGAA